MSQIIAAESTGAPQVHTHNDKRHGFQDGDYVSFEEVFRCGSLSVFVLLGFRPVVQAPLLVWVQNKRYNVLNILCICTSKLRRSVPGSIEAELNPK